MDSERFDTITRTLALGMSRRGVLRTLGGVSAGGVLAVVGRGNVGKKTREGGRMLQLGRVSCACLTRGSRPPGVSCGPPNSCEIPGDGTCSAEGASAVCSKRESSSRGSPLAILAPRQTTETPSQMRIMVLVCREGHFRHTINHERSHSRGACLRLSHMEKPHARRLAAQGPAAAARAASSAATTPASAARGRCSYNGPDNPVLCT